MEIKVAKEAPPGANGEYRGIICPKCGVRIFPKGGQGQIEMCVTCGEDYMISEGVRSWIK